MEDVAGSSCVRLSGALKGPGSTGKGWTRLRVERRGAAESKRFQHPPKSVGFIFLKLSAKVIAAPFLELYDTVPVRV